MENFETQVRKGFQKCRSDIEVVSTSNSKLRNDVLELKDENNELKSLVREMSSQMNELKAELKGVNIALEYIKGFNQAQVQQPQQTVAQVVAPVQEEVKKETKTPEIKDPYEALMQFKAKSNKKDYFKQKMLQMLEENDGMILSELKFLFVDHFKYCSKASFYNYLKEVELEKYIKIQRNSGKNRVYLARPDIISQENLI